jgi:hypothetical protein
MPGGSVDRESDIRRQVAWVSVLTALIETAEAMLSRAVEGAKLKGLDLSHHQEPGGPDSESASPSQPDHGASRFGVGAHTVQDWLLRAMTAATSSNNITISPFGDRQSPSGNESSTKGGPSAESAKIGSMGSKKPGEEEVAGSSSPTTRVPVPPSNRPPLLSPHRPQESNEAFANAQPNQFGREPSSRDDVLLVPSGCLWCPVQRLLPSGWRPVQRFWLDCSCP